MHITLRHFEKLSLKKERTSCRDVLIRAKKKEKEKKGEVKNELHLELLLLCVLALSKANPIK